MRRLSVLLLLFVAGSAPGQCYSSYYPRYSYSYPSYSYCPPKVVTVVKKEYVPVAKVFAIPFLVPTFSATYTPPAVKLAVATPAVATSAPAVRAAPAGDLAQVLTLLRSFDGRIKTMETQFRRLAPAPGAPADRAPPKKAPGPAKAPTAAEGLRVALSACAKCHEAKVSEDKGGGFTMFTGQSPARLTDAQARKAMTLARKEKMPKKPNRPLNDYEYEALCEWLDSLKPAPPPAPPPTPDPKEDTRIYVAYGHRARQVSAEKPGPAPVYRRRTKR